MAGRVLESTAVLGKVSGALVFFCPAKGTFKVMHFALRFFFRETLGRDWDLFKKK